MMWLTPSDLKMLKRIREGNTYSIVRDIHTRGYEGPSAFFNGEGAVSTYLNVKLYLARQVLLKQWDRDFSLELALLLKARAHLSEKESDRVNSDIVFLPSSDSMRMVRSKNPLMMFIYHEFTLDGYYRRLSKEACYYCRVLQISLRYERELFPVEWGKFKVALAQVRAYLAGIGG